MIDQEEFVRRQRALAAFGEFVLDNDDLQKILDEGCRLVAHALAADLAKVVEIDRASGTGLVRAGVGWNSDVVGKARIELNERSSEAYAIEQGEPVVTQDIGQEDRFEFPQFMRDHGVAAIVNVPIVLPGRKPYGLLQVDSRQPREFGQDDIAFLKTYAMVLGPVIDRLKNLVELKNTHERLHLIVENARDYVIVLSDADDLITDWLAGSEAILGWRTEEIIGKPTKVLFTPEDRAHGVSERELEQARRGGAAPNVRWHLRKDGSKVFLDGQTVALRGPDGELRGFLKIGQDVTDRRRNDERQAVLLAELQHRVRNVLAMVRSVVRRTVESAPSVKEIGHQLEGRIDALARTQALLTRALDRGVDLENMVREELLAQAAEDHRVSIAGAPVQLAPKIAEVLTLAIHELATNATKHGVLGQGAGMLAIEWRVADEAGAKWLHLSWVESGVRVATAAPRRVGFGTELITRRVPYELNGRGRIDLRPGGVHCEIQFPLVEGDSILGTGSPR
ncbi:MAG: signal transduction histidine kinase [Phenylobacterium sp.]|nr:signal transduction histidine kinase [Phenylobacterium sp.]